jgi:hypothetical protein
VDVDARGHPIAGASKVTQGDPLVDEDIDRGDVVGEEDWGGRDPRLGGGQDDGFR